MARVVAEIAAEELFGGIAPVEGHDLGFHAPYGGGLFHAVHGEGEEAVERLLRREVPGGVQGSDDALGTGDEKIAVSDGPVCPVQGGVAGQEPAPGQRDQDLPDRGVVPPEFGEPGRPLFLEERQEALEVDAADGNDTEAGHVQGRAWSRFCFSAISERTSECWDRMSARSAGVLRRADFRGSAAFRDKRMRP